MAESPQPHIRRPRCRKGQSIGEEARMSSLSGSGTRALLDVHMATLRCAKSRQKGDLYSLAEPGGTIG